MAETPEEYNTKIIAESRANKGHVGGMWEGTPLLLLHHTGATSGVSRVNPVAYLPDDGRYFIWPANGGASKHPASYHNIKELDNCPAPSDMPLGGTIEGELAQRSTALPLTPH
ncbi:MAG: nitroreductase/quinone reductase family protein [Acidimicrobiales bacterium]